MASNEGLTSYTNVLLHHVPNEYAPSALFSILVGTFAFAIMAAELAYNNSFDRHFLTAPGWSHPHRAATRAAYFIMRLIAMLNLTLAVVYQNVPGLDCVPFYASLRATWYISVVCVDFIFYSRTLALYGWPKKLWIPVTVSTLFYVILGAYDTALWGTAFQIPGSDFCAYIAADIYKASRLQKQFLIQYSFSLVTDTAILILTLLRLSKMSEKNNIGANWKSQSGKNASQMPTRNGISRTLIIQGFILYGSLELAHLGLVLVFFVADYRQSWTSATYTLIILLKVITASNLVRLTSDAVRKTRMDPTSQTISHRSNKSAFTAASAKADQTLEPLDEDVEKRTDENQGSSAHQAPTFEVTTVQHVHTLTFDEVQERNRMALYAAERLNS